MSEIENVNVTVEETTENVEVEETKKENFFKKLGTGIVNGAKATGKFLGNHIGGVVTVAVVIIGGVAYYLIKNGATEEIIPVDDETDIPEDEVEVTEDIEEGKIVNF